MSKPNINIPTEFAVNGDKTDFPQAKITNGFDRLQPDVLPGDCLNKFIDDTYKGLNGVLELYEGCVLYDVTETYSNTSIVFYIDTNDNNKIKIYHSLQNSNTGNSLSDDTYWEEVQLGGDLSGKADVDLSNTTPTISFATAMNTAGIRTVIETYVNGTSWYRVYSDGWCEQGGYSAGSSVRTVNLLKAYNNTNYSVFLQGKHTDYWAVVNNVGNITGSKFTIYAIDNDRHCFWKACGYIN